MIWLKNIKQIKLAQFTGIFLRIVSEASYEEYDNGIDLNTITPFWRMVNPNSKLAGKLACGIDFIAERHIKKI